MPDTMIARGTTSTDVTAWQAPRSIFTPTESRRSPYRTEPALAVSSRTMSRCGEKTVRGSSFFSALKALSLAAHSTHRRRSSARLRPSHARSSAAKTRSSKRGCVAPRALSGSARSTTSFPTIEMFLLHLGELCDNLSGDVARAAEPGVSRPRLDRRKQHPKFLAAYGDRAEGLLMRTAQVDAEHPALGKRRDDPTNARRRDLHVYAARAATAAFGKDHADLASREEVDEAGEDFGDLPALPAPGDRQALHHVAENLAERRVGEVAPFRQIPRD